MSGAAVRTALYAPAHSMAYFERAIAARPDAVIIDLEDGTPPDERALARLSVGHLVERTRAANLLPVVRINGADTAEFDLDVEMLLDARPASVLLPKASADSVAHLRDRLGGSATITIWALLERARDVLAADSIAALEIATTLTIGYGDLCKEFGLPLGLHHPEFDGVRTVVLSAAQRHGLSALDGVVIGSGPMVMDACLASSRQGFDGRTLYDPRHVADCHSAFAQA